MPALAPSVTITHQPITFWKRSNDSNNNDDNNNNNAFRSCLFFFSSGHSRLPLKALGSVRASSVRLLQLLLLAVGCLFVCLFVCLLLLLLLLLLLTVVAVVVVVVAVVVVCCFCCRRCCWLLLLLLLLLLFVCFFLSFFGWLFVTEARLRRKPWASFFRTDEVSYLGALRWLPWCHTEHYGGERWRI